MRDNERLYKKIKTVYTEIIKRLVDPTFKFPSGGKVERQLDNFIMVCKKTYGEITVTRLVDYCIFQAHKNRNSAYQNNLAPKVFGNTGFQKYLLMSSRQKKYMEDQWLSEAQLTRDSLTQLICDKHKEHPLAQYIYMPSEERTKLRCINTDAGYMICSISTLMWSPFSPACQQCMNVEKCRKETQVKYPELYRIRLEKDGERK